MRGWIVVAALALAVAGCVSPPEATEAAATDQAMATEPVRVFFHTGNATAPNATELAEPAPAVAAEEPALPLPPIPNVLARTLEWDGAEPTLGVTSNGNIFLVAMANVLRSTDGGETWEVVSTPASSPTTLDPYLYVDPDTDRVYSDQLYLGCSYLSWSDDYGATWLTNPAACGIPVNDHQKMVSAVNRGLVPTTPLYSKVLLYAYNAIAAGSRVSISYDGGFTWPVNAESVSAAEATCNGGLHGNIVASADGMLYIPKRHCDGFILAKSADSGITWTTTPVGADAGGSECRKNADLAVDRTGGLYGAWPGKDNRLYLSTSTDEGSTWRERSVVASPPEVNMTTMPAVVAGDAGRIAMVYYGTADGARGPDEVADTAVWHVYVTYSLDALAETPTFVTYRATDDPVQIGAISTNSDCSAPDGSRNLLDFLDAQLAPDGRLVIAYTDGCIDECVESPTMQTSRAGKAGFGILQSGASLYADVGLIEAPLEVAA